MKNLDIIVVGLGASAKDAASILERFTTIGVNDVGTFLSPTYLVVLDKKQRFTSYRQEVIENTLTTKAFMCHPDDWTMQCSVTKLLTKKFTHAPLDGWNLDTGPIPHFMTSPFVGIGLAYRLGAKRIGVIGMDLKRDHHLSKYAGQINQQLRNLKILLDKKGVGLYNLSGVANLPALPFKPLMAMTPSERKPT